MTEQQLLRQARRTLPRAPTAPTRHCNALCRPGTRHRVLTRRRDPCEREVDGRSASDECDHCVAATPVRITDIEDLASLISQVAAHGTTASAWPPPAANTLFVPATGLTVSVTGLTVPAARRSA